MTGDVFPTTLPAEVGVRASKERYLFTASLAAPAVPGNAARNSSHSGNAVPLVPMPPYLGGDAEAAILAFLDVEPIRVHAHLPASSISRAKAGLSA